MLRGIYISSEGEVDILGYFYSYQPIIQAMRQCIVEFDMMERKKLAQTLDEDTLQSILRLKQDMLTKEINDGEST